MRLTNVDYILLARAARGHVLTQSEQDLCSEQGRIVLKRLLNIPPGDRLLMLSSIVSVSDYQRIMLVPEDAAVPLPGNFRLLSFEQLRALPPPRLLLPGVPAESLIVLYGESGTGKSFLALDFALRLTAQGAVVYVPTEGTHGYLPRIDAWAQHHRRPVPNNLYFIPSGINLMKPDLVKDLVRQLKSIRPVLAVIDTLAMAMIGADENSARDVGIVLANVRALISECQTSVMLVHLTTKGTGSERGSSSLRGNADSMLKVSNYDDLLALDCTKSKDFEPFKRQYYTLKQVARSMVLLPCDAVDGDRRTLTKLQSDIVATMRLETCSDGVTLRELAELVSSPISTLHRAVSRLMQAGHVEKSKSGYRLTASGIRLSDPRDPSTHSEVDQEISPHDPPIHMIHPVSHQQLRISMDHVDQRINYYQSGL